MAKMTKTQAHAELKAQGVPDEDIKALGKVPGLDWATLLQLLAQYGPQLLAVLLALFAKKPLPTPAPTLTPKS